MRGPDAESDRRQLRERDGDPLGGFWKFADDVGTGGAEVLFLSLPGTVLLVNAIQYRPGPQAFAALVAIAAGGFVAGLLGGGWLSVDPPWPAWGVASVCYRTVHYSVALLALGLGGAVVVVEAGPLVAAVAVTLGSALVVAALPRLFALSGRALGALRAWHRYLFGPADPPTF